MSSVLARRKAGLLADTLRFAAVALVLGGILSLAPLGLGQALGAGTTQIKVSAGAVGATQSVSMDVNKSLILDLPVDVQEVIVSQPAVANASPDMVNLVGRVAGLVAWPISVTPRPPGVVAIQSGDMSVVHTRAALEMPVKRRR